MNSYCVMPMIYDRLMKNVDYNNWARFINRHLMSTKAMPMHNILELGCGTGNCTKEFLDLGYEVVGIDVSAEMLEVAREKLKAYDDKVILIEQDICQLDFDVYEIDAVVCCNDTFNYILEESDVKRLLAYLYPRIKAGGFLIFDISSEYKLRYVLGNNTFGESFDDMVYLWENFYSDEDKSVSMDINFFIKQGKGYERFFEEHVQKAYSHQFLADIAREAGFRSVRLYSDFALSEGVEDKAERIFFVCEK